MNYQFSDRGSTTVFTSLSIAERITFVSRSKVVISKKKTIDGTKFFGQFWGQVKRAINT